MEDVLHVIETLVGIAIAEIAMFNKGPRTIVSGHSELFLVNTFMDAVGDLD